MKYIENLKRSEIDLNLSLKKEIMEFVHNNDLDLNWKTNFRQIIYHYVNELKSIPICKCGKENNFKSFAVGYRKTCSFVCSNSSDEKKAKIAQTKLEKYGDPNYNNSKKSKHTKFKKYGDENFNNREKAFLTNISKYGHISPMSNPIVIEKSKQSKLKKYGDSTYNNSDKIKDFWKKVDESFIREMVEKIKMSKKIKYGDSNFNNPIKMKNTKIERYGFYFNNSEKMVETKIENGQIFFDKKEWDIYRKNVNSLTRRNKKKLFENWNGLDYYDNEKIIGYFSLNHTHRFYPTIDHRISVFYGYKNNLDYNLVGGLDNLCITKRYINSIKRTKIDSEFNLKDSNTY